MIDRRQATRWSLALPWLAFTARVQAQAFPSQPIKVVVPYPPAGATDVLARLVAERVGAATGWAFVVENKPGAGGNLGLDQVAKSKGDGYTLAVAQTSNLAVNPSLYPKMPYDALKDFSPIAFIAEQPVVVTVRADSPYRTLADLVAAAKTRGGTITMASAGNGTVGHLAGELLARRAGFRMLHIPYKGAAPALTDLMGGQTEFMLPTPQAVLPLVKGGKLRALAVTSAKRLPVIGEVPTVAESGFPGFTALDWKVLVGPAGMAADVIKRLNDEVDKALGQTSTVGKLLADGSAPMSGSPAALAKFLQEEHSRWGAVVRDAGVKLD